MAAYGRSVALQDTRFAHFLSLSLSRELEYPLLSICILLFSVAETHFFFYCYLSAFSLLTFRSREWERKYVTMGLHLALSWIDLMGMV